MPVGETPVSRPVPNSTAPKQEFGRQAELRRPGDSAAARHYIIVWPILLCGHCVFVVNLRERASPHAPAHHPRHLDARAARPAARPPHHLHDRGAAPYPLPAGRVRPDPAGLRHRSEAAGRRRLRLQESSRGAAEGHAALLTEDAAGLHVAPEYLQDADPSGAPEEAESLPRNPAAPRSAAAVGPGRLPQAARRSHRRSRRDRAEGFRGRR